MLSRSVVRDRFILSPTHVTLGIRLGRPFNSSAPAYAIAVTALVLLPMLATAPAAAGTAAVEALAKSLGVSVEAIRPPPASPWGLVEDATGVTLETTSKATYSLTLSDVPLFGFHATARQGTMTFLLDGAVIERFANENEPYDVALPAGQHTLSWSFAPSASGAVSDLVLDGVKPVRAPVITAALLDLVGCVTPPAHMTIVAAFEPTAVDAFVDGQQVPATYSSALRGLGVVTQITIDVPSMQEGSSTHDLLVIVHDAAGQAWQLARQALRTVVDLTTITGPRDWAYQMRPLVFLTTTCMPQDVASIRLTVDGIERLAQAGVVGASWRFDRDLPFGEQHAWRFDVRLANGVAIAREGAFREGLDVMEFDLSPGTVLSQSDLSSVFGSPTSPDELPLVPVLGSIPSFLLSSVEGFHARAVYAPLAISCSNLFGARFCLPYGNGHDDAALWANEQTLTLSDSNGAHTYPALGQVAAMSRMERVPLPAPPVPQPPGL